METALTAERDPRTEAAAAMRRLGHAMMAHEVGDDLLLRVAEAADRVADDLESQPRRRRDYVDIKRRMYEADLTEGRAISHFDECFVSGSQNPMGIAMEVRREGEEMVAQVVLGAAFEGAPGRSHGGIVAAVFDDVLGYLTTLHATPAFTGSLTVNYLAPTPIGVPLEFRARVLNRDGRRIFTSAEATTPEGVIVATATATFIAVALEAFRP